MRWIPPRMPRDGTAAGAAGATGTGGTTTDERTISLADAKRLIEREGKGDSARAVVLLMRDNQKARERAREAEAQLAALKAKVPADGSVVLTGEDATAYNAVKAVGIALPKLLEKAKQADELAGKLAAQERRDIVAKIAKENGWNGQVLAELLETRGLAIEQRDATVTTNGKSEVKKLPHVRKASDAAAAPELLTVYVDTQLRSFLPALTAQGADLDDGGEEQVEGTEFVPQGGTQRTTPRGSRKDDAELMRSKIKTSGISYAI